MPKREPNAAGGGRSPWHCKVEDQLRERPGVVLISLLTDEAGAAWIARGEVPEYMRAQAIDALRWCGTLERGLVELDPPAPGAVGSDLLSDLPDGARR